MSLEKWLHLVVDGTVDVNMSAKGRELSSAMARELCSSTTCYAEPNGRDRPEADTCVGAI